MALGGGTVLSHSMQSENWKNSNKNAQFKKGDSVRVEFLPSTGKLVYTVNGQPDKRLELSTNIHPATQQAVHFCVFLYGKSDSVKLI